jgi:glycosyltransferase involved in cell wall biosynthesis
VSARETSLALGKVLVVSHTSDLAGPTEALLTFVKQRVSYVMFVLNPLDYCVTGRRTVTVVQNGRVFRSFEPPNTKPTALGTWILDVLFSFYYPLRSRARYDLFIGCNCLNAFVGCCLRRLGVVRRVVFYAIDWTSKRFNSRVLNAFYHAMDRYAARHSDELWSISERINEIRVRQGIDVNKLKVVPVGVYHDQIPDHVPTADDRWRVVFLGALERSKGIELVIDCWPEVVRKWPKAELNVIGRTPKGVTARPYEEILRDLPNVALHGVMSHEDVLSLLPKMGIGLAPYAPIEGSISAYADPSRVKDYLACGLPVVITRVPPIAADIEAARAGYIFEYDRQDFIECLDRVFADSTEYISTAENAHSLGRKFDWNVIFEKALNSATV